MVASPFRRAMLPPREFVALLLRKVDPPDTASVLFVTAMAPPSSCVRFDTRRQAIDKDHNYGWVGPEHVRLTTETRAAR